MFTSCAYLQKKTFIAQSTQPVMTPWQFNEYLIGAVIGVHYLQGPAICDKHQLKDAVICEHQLQGAVIVVHQLKGTVINV